MQLGSIALVLLCGGCSTATAFVEPEVPSGFASFEYIAPELVQATEWKITERPNNNTITGDGGDKGSSPYYVDGRSGKPVVLMPAAPVLPGGGVGNRLLWTVGTSHDEGHGPLTDHRMLSEAAVEACRVWITEHQDELGINVGELFADGMVRTATLPNGDIQISLYRTYKNIEVVGSRVAINIVAGNIVTVALEQWGDLPIDFDVTPAITAEDAMNVLSTHTGHALMVGEETCDSEVQILSLANNDDIPVELSASLRGTTVEPVQVTLGYKHILTWKVCPKFDGQGDAHSFQGYVDARTKRILEFTNTVDLFEAEGGVMPLSNDGKAGGIEQANWPMSHMQVGSSLTDVGGNFNVAGTASFIGRSAKLDDKCGVASLGLNGDINWGTSIGTDCSQGRVGGELVGGKGNTRASRTTYYHTTRIMDIARKHLPGNSWVRSQLRANVNINENCNAFWNGNSINFYNSGGSCNNLGEISGVIIHEWGHGMDANDVARGIASPSGEGVADIYAALYDGTSCIGRGGFSSICNLKGDRCKENLGCTGVRDIDYMRHDNQTPHTMTWAKNNCDGSVHCMGHVYSEAVWSLYKRKLPQIYGYDDLTALELTTYLFFQASGNVATWYDKNGKNPPFGGCGGNSGYRAFLAADDNDGNLGNGTPHMRAIYAAFVDQQIACNDVVVQDDPGCANKPVDRPVVTATSGDKFVRLNWSAVGNAASYDVMRAEGGCEKGKVKVANQPSGTRTFQDNSLKNGFEYCYLIVPKGTLGPSSCYGKTSTTIKVIPGDVTIPVTPQPTQPPSPQPTQPPSPQPTQPPSPQPTQPPSPQPTPLPTPNPINPPTPQPTPQPTPFPSIQPTPIPTSPPTPNTTTPATPNPTVRPTQIPTSPPIGSSETLCNTDASEKIFRLDLKNTPEVAGNISWKVNSFDILTETFVEYKASGVIQPTERICVPPGTYEVVISNSAGTGMGVGGSYAGFFGGKPIFASGSTDVNWGERRHIFCYGECASTSPSLSPTKTVELPPPGGQQDAVYDTALKVPRCATASSSCSSGQLLKGRGTVGPEPNFPNTLDGCIDSEGGDYNISESIEAITVSSDTQDNMKEGDTVTITAKVVCWYVPTKDFADFYSATNVGVDSPPQWEYRGSLSCPDEGSADLSVSFVLPKGRVHAVRVNFYYNRERDTSTSCIQGDDYSDVDDLVFTVVENNFQESLI